MGIITHFSPFVNRLARVFSKKFAPRRVPCAALKTQKKYGGSTEQKGKQVTRADFFAEKQLRRQQGEQNRSHRDGGEQESGALRAGQRCGCVIGAGVREPRRVLCAPRRRGLRMEGAMRLLLRGEHTVREVAFLSGFSDEKYFSRAFRKHYGKPPSSFLGRK